MVAKKAVIFLLEGVEILALGPFMFLESAKIHFSSELYWEVSGL